MDKRNIIMVISALLLCLSIIINGYLIGEAIKSLALKEENIATTKEKVLNLSQVANYLNITEEEVKAIIKTEQEHLNKLGSFHGKMFPYFTLDNKQYFNVDEIDVWLEEVSASRRTYDFKKGFVVQ